MVTGKDANGKSIDPIRQRSFATNVPNQRFFISSASDVSTPFYRFYREFGKKQIMGDPDFCVLHIDCDICFAPTLRGEVVAPLLSRSQVESQDKISRDQSDREYRCIFTTDGGSNAIIRRGVITRNEEIRKPVFSNPNRDKKYIITYDPARVRDNSIITVAELYNDGTQEKPDLKARIVNCVSLIDVGKKTKCPMQMPDQVDYLRKLILSYNGGETDIPYENIVGVWIDGGAGGQPMAVIDGIISDWTTSDGVTHRGLIDKEYSSEYISRFPNAVNKLHVMQPTKYKSLMYEALIEMMNQDKIKFTPTYDHKGYMTIFTTDEKVLSRERKRLLKKYKDAELPEEEIKEKIDEELMNVSAVKTKTVKLDWMDELAFANIDAMKQEIINMTRRKRQSGRDSFELTPEKANKMHKSHCAYAA